MGKFPTERAQQLAKIVYREGAHSEGVAQNKYLLTELGYHPADDRTDRYDEDVTRPVRIFQAYFHLSVAGDIDVQSLKLLRSSRCGVRDMREGVDLKALSEALGDSGSEADDAFTFRFNSGPWDTYDLRYHIYNGSPD